MTDGTREYTLTFAGGAGAIRDPSGISRSFPDLPPLTLSQAAPKPDGPVTDAPIPPLVKTVMLPDGTTITISIAINEHLARLTALREAAPEGPASTSVFVYLSTGNGAIKLGNETQAQDMTGWSMDLTCGITETVTQGSP